MRDMELKYGCNPHQKPARVFAKEGELPLIVRNGRPGYINLLDALNGWQLVRELQGATGLPAAASFKHVSPAGAAVGLPLCDILRRMYFVGEGELSPLACAYARARGADRMSSFGDWIALSGVCDESAARLIAPEVSDGIIAPGYEPRALEILKAKRKGAYTVLEIDPAYQPPRLEQKDVFGVTFEQERNEWVMGPDFLDRVVTQQKVLPAQARRDLAVALITLKYTQSNSVCYVKDGQAIGIGAGQQSRIHCTRLAGDKADLWWLRRHPKALALPFLPGLKNPDRDNAMDRYLSREPEEVLAPGRWEALFSARPAPLTQEEKRDWLSRLSGVSLGSDAFFPFPDNIHRAARSGVAYVAQPGGSVRDEQVIQACDEHGMVMAMTGVRLFHH